MHDDEGEDERELFRRAMQGVRPLRRSGRHAPARAPRRARAVFARAERAAVLRESLGTHDAPALGVDLYDVQPGDELLFRRAGIPEGVLRRLRRGHFRVEAEIDLHGLNATQATHALREYLQMAKARGLQCVRIVHGKGLRSGQRGPVLKNLVNQLLRRAEPVLGFASAPPAAGGTGATLVLLRTR